MAVSLKPGVSLRNMQPQALFAIHVAEEAFERLAGVDTVVTDCWRDPAKAAPWSMHPYGKGVDFRTKHITGELRRSKIMNIVSSMKNHLGDEYKVIYEFLDEPQEHIHVEYRY